MYRELFIARKEIRKSQSEIADVIGITRVSYNNKELGKSDFTIREAHILALYFNKTMDELFPIRN